MKCLAEPEKHETCLFGRRFIDRNRGPFGGIAARRHRAKPRCAWDGTQSGIVMSASALHPHIVLADARVHEDVINVLHVARVDPLIAGRDSPRFAFLEAGFARQPLGEAVMHVALEGERSRAEEQQACAEENRGGTHDAGAMVPEAIFSNQD